MKKNSPAPRSAVEVLEARIAPATFTVTTVADGGPGSLRQAILDANALTGRDSILFDLSASAIMVITPLSPLPPIVDSVDLSGLVGGTAKVRLDGTTAGAAAGLTLSITSAATGRTWIHNLEIANFTGAGILLDHSVGEVTVSDSLITANGGDGIHVIFGGSNYFTSNSVSKNGGNGLLIENSDSNVIGGNTFEANASSGIALKDSSKNAIGFLQGSYYNGISGNTSKANGYFGLRIQGGGANVIGANSITENGTASVDSGQGGGVFIIDSGANRIGELAKDGTPINSYYASSYYVGNSIKGNHGTGILVQGGLSSGTRIVGNTVSGNVDGDGIRLDGVSNVTFADFEGQRTARSSMSKLIGNNILGNSGWGIVATNGSSVLDVRGASISGNGAGALLLDHVSNAVIGGDWRYYETREFQSPRETSRDENVIRFDAGPGVVVKDSSGVKIFANQFVGTGVPIDLGGDGATANDPADLDNGANHLQNYPTLVHADTTSGETVATFATDAPNTQFRIQLFGFDSSTATYSSLATQDVTTDADGKAVITFTGTGSQVYATATNLVRGETSELSIAAEIRPRVSILSTSLAEGDSGVRTAAVNIVLNEASNVPVTVSYRSQDYDAKAGEDYGAVEGTVIFQPGEITKTVPISVFGDSFQERWESFHVDLSSLQNGVYGQSSASVTIINDDRVPSVSIQDVVTSEGANVSSSHPGYSEVQYTLTLSNASLELVNVKLSAVGGTAAVYSDYDPLDGVIYFAPGVTSVTKTIFIKNDTTREGTETIQLQLSEPTAGTLGSANATLTIADDDTWVIQSDPVQVVEGQNGQTMAQMHVRLVNSFGVTDHDQPISVNYGTQNGTALAGDDYVAVQGAVTFQPGEFEKTIAIPVSGDTSPEQNEVFSVAFSAPLGAAIGKAAQSVTILNDDAGALSVSPASIVEGHSGQKMLVFSVSLSVPTTESVSVGFETQGGTAFAGMDYEAVSGRLSFAPGETQKTVSVPIYGDRLTEADETFTLHLKEPAGATIAQADATGTIVNDEPTVSIADGQYAEGDSSNPSAHSVFIPVRLSLATDIPVSVSYSSVNGTAEAPSDYVATSGTLTFAAGQTVQYIEVQVIGDTVYEPNETFSISLSDPQGAPLGKSTGVFTIQSDEPFFSAQDVSITEGQFGNKLLTFTISLSQAQSAAASVDFATADGTALAGLDYTATSGTLTFSPGETTKTISVSLIGDTAYESDETLTLLLSNPLGAGVASPEVHGTILNDDTVPPVLSVSQPTMHEGNASTHALVFTFSLSSASTSLINVDFATADGTAFAGSDYTATSGTLTFSPGETTKTVFVPVVGDTVYESDETVTLLLSNAPGAGLSTPEVHGTILNDDAPPVLPALSVSHASALEGSVTGGSLVFTLSLSKASTSPVSLAYGTADGSGLAGVDYASASGTLVFAPGETTKTISVPVIGDTLAEQSETVRLLLSGVSGATALQTEATGTIFDDDGVSPGVVVQISKGGHQATWTDHDGDQVKLVSSKAILTQRSFIFGSDSGTGVVSLEYLDVPASAKGATSLVFSVKKGESGDGLVDVEQINALGRDLTLVSIPGRLGTIQAGDANLKTAGILDLRVDSFGLAAGLDAGGGNSLESEIYGGIGSFSVKHDFIGAHLAVHGGSIQSVKIGGDLKGVAAEGETGISVEKSLVHLKVGGNVAGADAAHPVTIEGAHAATQALTAFSSVNISGSVSHADFIAGENSTAAIHVGSVTVGGNWQVSNLAVATSTGEDGVYGTGDDAAYSNAISTIAKITVKGAISGTPADVNALDHFGFVAGRIGAFQVGGQKLHLSAKGSDTLELGTTSDITLVEVSGQPLVS